MRIVKYPSISSILSIWQTYFKNKPPSIVSDFDLACYIEKSLFTFGVDDAAVLVFMDEERICGIMPVSYEKEKGWSYYPSYIFISIKVTIDDECWSHLPDLLPKPFRIYETSFKTKIDFPWLSKSEANVIHLSPYSTLSDYLTDLDKKNRSKFKNCLNRNIDIEVNESNEYREDKFSVNIRQGYMDYCTARFEGTDDLSYFQNQLSIFPELFKAAARLGDLVTLELRLNGELIAINYSILSEDIIYDYICYRHVNEDLEKRSIGILAILKNIEISLIKSNVSYYDLASEFSYKKQFLPKVDYQQITLSLGE